MNGKVWAVQSSMRRNDDGSWSPRFDLSRATEYGDIEFIFGHGQAALMGSSAVRAVIAERLQSYNPETDYILPIGDTVLIGIVFATLARMGQDKGIKALRWDGQARRYDIINI